MTIKKHEVPEELLASLLADYKKPEDLIGEIGPLKQLTKRLVEKGSLRRHENSTQIESTAKHID